jgi:UDP-N-acetylmuramate dehydrogenase
VSPPALDGDALLARLPPVRGRLAPMRALAPLTWLRVGGPAEVMFRPADADDLAAFLAACPAEIPVTPVGVGSNLLVRDGGIPGVVVRLGRGFAGIAVEGAEIRAGAAAPDARVAEAAAEAGVAGLEFLRGIPGTIGGALAMNAGAYGCETKDVLVAAEAVDRAGRRLTLAPGEMGFSYRRAAAAEGLIFTAAVLRGAPDAPEAVRARMTALLAKREAAQPVREKTGGSTFANPSGASSTGRDGEDHALKAWKLIDEAGCRSLTVGEAAMSGKHCNFMVNLGNASAADFEALGETVRARVKSASGIDLCWEIRRVGVRLTE